MRTSQAEVLIIDDDHDKADGLRRMIEAAGGVVVDHLTDIDAAVARIGSSSFTESPSRQNVVLLDGELQRHNNDGVKLFTYGRRKGRLHGVSEHAPGILAVSCSSDRYADIGHDTGATVSEWNPQGWAKVLDGQLDDPQFAPDGAIEREVLDGFDIGQAMPHALGGQAINRLVALRLSTASQEGAEPEVLALDDPELTAIAEPQLLVQAMSGRGGPRAVRKFGRNPAFSATAAFTTETGLVVISRDQRPNPHSGMLSQPVLTNCAFDKMPFPTLDQIPPAYWADRQLDPSRF